MKDTKSSAMHLLALPPPKPPTVRCYWVVPGKLLAGAYPESREPLERGKRAAELWNAGIRTFVSLVEEKEHGPASPALTPYRAGVERLAEAAGERPTCLRFPIVDMGVTTVDAMHTILNVIDLSLEADKPVYVHCFGGIGRTGTVVGCWLLRHGLATKADVFDVLTRLRKVDEARADWASPETEDQRAMVRDWRG